MSAVTARTAKGTLRWSSAFSSSTACVRAISSSTRSDTSASPSSAAKRSSGGAAGSGGGAAALGAIAKSWPLSMRNELLGC
eukprot:scaffold34673_cov60-Phaeocystis_antarctica.AAC.1